MNTQNQATTTEYRQWKELAQEYNTNVHTLRTLSQTFDIKPEGLDAILEAREQLVFGPPSAVSIHDKFEQYAPTLKCLADAYVKVGKDTKDFEHFLDFLEQNVVGYLEEMRFEGTPRFIPNKLVRKALANFKGNDLLNAPYQRLTQEDFEEMDTEERPEYM